MPPAHGPGAGKWRVRGAQHPMGACSIPVSGNPQRQPHEAKGNAVEHALAQGAACVPGRVHAPTGMLHGMHQALAQVGGKGGGKPDLAQAGGTNVAALPGVLAAASDYLSSKL